MSSKLKVNNIIPSTGTQIGISTTGGGINLLTGTVVTGVVTATSFVGGLPITNGANNRIITASSASAIQGEANLTYDGANQLKMVGSGQQDFMIGSTNAGGAYLILDGDSNGDAIGADYAYIAHDTGGDVIIGGDNPAGNAEIIFKAGNNAEKLRIQNDGTVYLRGSSSSDSHRLQVRVNDTDTEFRGSSSSGTNKGFAFYSSNTNGSEKVRIGSDGTVTLQAEDLVFGTTGKGIEFPNSVSIKQNVSNLYANLASGNNNIEFQSNGTSFVKFRGTNGDVEIVDGNLKLSTSGHGIDFSSTGGGSGTSNESEILTDYEHGEWTPILHHYINGGFSPPSYSAAGTVVGRYTKIGNIVHISASFLGFNISNAHGSSFGRITGLPFTSTNHPNHRDVISAMSDAFTTGGVNFSTYWNQTNLNSMKHGTSVFDWAILSGGSVKNLVISGHYTAA